MFVATSNGDLMIAAVEIKFGEVACCCETVVQVVDAWDREGVFDCNVVECAIVNAHAHASIFFLDEEYWCAKRAGGWADVSGFEVFVDLSFCLCEFVWCLSIETPGWDDVVGVEVDCMW